MGKFISVLAAYLLVCYGYQIFRSPPEVMEGPQNSLLIFLSAMFLLLLDLRLYPSNLRKLNAPGQILVEYLAAMFILEVMLLDFWIPLEKGVSSLCFQAGRKLQEIDEDNNFEVVTETLLSPTAPTVVSYSISIFFFLAVLHATRVVDFRTLKNGPACFYCDSCNRMTSFLKKKLRYLGRSVNKRVTIKEDNEITNCLFNKATVGKCNKRSKKKDHNILNLDEIKNFNEDLDELKNELDLDCDDIAGLGMKLSDFDVLDDDILLIDE